MDGALPPDTGGRGRQAPGCKPPIDLRSLYHGPSEDGAHLGDGCYGGRYVMDRRTQALWAVARGRDAQVLQGRLAALRGSTPAAARRWRARPGYACPWEASPGLPGRQYVGARQGWGWWRGRAGGLRARPSVPAGPAGVSLAARPWRPLGMGRPASHGNSRLSSRAPGCSSAVACWRRGAWSLGVEQVRPGRGPPSFAAMSPARQPGGGCRSQGRRPTASGWASSFDAPEDGRQARPGAARSGRRPRPQPASSTEGAGRIVGLWQRLRHARLDGEEWPSLGPQRVRTKQQGPGQPPLKGRSWCAGGNHGREGESAS